MGEVLSETVEFGGKRYTAITEGRARILTPFRETESPGPAHKTSRNNNNNVGVQTVFYNKIQQFNRDLTILAILAHGEGALVEKASRTQKRSKGAKKQRDAKKIPVAAQSEATTVDAGTKDATFAGKVPAESANKRKLEESLEGGAVNGIAGQGPSKKLRVEDSDPRTADIIVNGGSESQTDIEVTTKQEGTHGRQSTGQSGSASRYTILDALSATGLRALRYAKEIPFATRIVANDLLPEAVRAIETNVKFNGVQDVVTANLDDARAFMYSKVGNESSTRDDSYVHRFDVVDLDPYGTAAPFFDSAIQALQDGGLLCVTCTDAGVFASNGYPEKAYSLYAGTTMKGVHSHEAGLRLILHAISLSAAKYGIAIEPLLSLSIDFYARLFVRIHKRPNEVKLLSGTSMLTYNCDSGCGAWTVQKIGRNIAQEAKNGDRYYKFTYAQGPSAAPRCEHCGFKTHVAGPMWAGPLHNPYFIKAILAKLPSLDRKVYGTVDRIEGMLKTAIEEDMSTKIKNVSEKGEGETKAVEPSSAVIPRAPVNAEDPMPFFFIPTYSAKILHTITPSEANLRSAFISLGYHVTRSHCKPGSFKTNAPWTVIWEIFREWVRQHSPIKDGVLKEGTAGYEIMKRVRGSDSAKLQSYKDDLIQRLSKVSSIDSLKSELEAGMFRLQDLPPPPSTSEERLPPSTTGNGNDTTSPLPSTNPEPPTEKTPSTLKITFNEKLGKENKEKLVRYQINMPHWGPMNRATGKST